MVENNYEVAIHLVLTAGDSKNESMMAIRAAREFNFEEAYRRLAEAEKKLIEVHELQTGLIQQEAGGEAVPVNIILVHAQDHLTTAIIMKDQAEEFLKLYQMLEPVIKNK